MGLSGCSRDAFLLGRLTLTDVSNVIGSPLYLSAPQALAGCRQQTGKCSKSFIGTAVSRTEGIRICSGFHAPLRQPLHCKLLPYSANSLVQSRDYWKREGWGGAEGVGRGGGATEAVNGNTRPSTLDLTSPSGYKY